MYNNELTLLGLEVIRDEIGQEIEVPTETKVLCKVKSIGRTEFYAAAQTGLKPSVIFIVHGYEYNGEEKVRYKGDDYKVLRSYSTTFEEVELTCEKVIADVD